ncbi:hypothetical protein [Streptomyces sp. NA02950]|uniref:hypothetical protein n=1 Tax=Streptomyces sp. NA02950 TaxID=2742137 RepID=UPI0020CACF51|nr:hypothetical protein [Streptomyces sp. NA02950]
MMVLPLDGRWLDRILEFADLPWSRQAHDDVFVRNGWHLEGEDGEPVVHWVDMWPLAGDFGKGWHIALGEYPGCDERGAAPAVVCDHPECRADCSVMLPVAYCAFGVVDHDDEPIPPEDYWDLDSMGGGIWLPHAVEDDWEVEYRRVEGLLRGRLGEPSSLEVPESLDAERALIWERGGYLVTLFSGPEWFAYGTYDWIGIEVRPRVRGAPP